MKAVVAAFNQEKALVGAFSVITNLWMELFEALVLAQADHVPLLTRRRVQVDSAAPDPEVDHVAAEAHRASDGAAASLPRRGGHLHPPATVAGAAAQGHHAGVHGVCSGVTPSL